MSAILSYIKDTGISIIKSSENEIIELWDKLGFLENIELKRNLALAFQVVQEKLIEDELLFKTEFGDFNGFICPIVKRIFNLMDSKYDMELGSIKTLTLDIMNELLSKLKELSSDFNVKVDGLDREAEFCKTFSETYYKNKLK